MNRFFTVTAALAIFLAATTMVCAKSYTYRDSRGHITGTSTTYSNGRTTYRDSRSHILGTSTMDRSGRVTYRDSYGRIRGTRK